ncbi:MAG TPA: TerC family protein [Paludibacter sp.]
MEYFEVFLKPEAWIALLTLTFLEMVLGIDNIVFISIVSSKLKKEEQPKARSMGLMIAMLFRIILLLGIQVVMSLTDPIFEFDFSWIKGGITGQSIIILAGGLFLLYKSVTEIHHKLEGEEEVGNKKAISKLSAAIIQIAILNLVFSFDSILTAIGLVSFTEFGAGALSIMIVSVILSILIMMAFAGPVSKFVHEHPTIQMLGLSFLILIGVMLITEASHSSNLEILGSHVGTIPKGYLYFAIAFSLLVESLNMKMRKKAVK